jgi:hypothetical protein
MDIVAVLRRWTDGLALDGVPWGVMKALARMGSPREVV